MSCTGDGGQVSSYVRPLYLYVRTSPCIVIDSFVARLDPLHPQKFVVKITCCEAVPLERGSLEIWQSYSMPSLAEAIVRHQVINESLALIVRYCEKAELTIVDHGRSRIYCLSLPLNGHPESASAATPVSDHMLQTDVLGLESSEHGGDRQIVTRLKSLFGETNTNPLIPACCDHL